MNFGNILGGFMQGAGGAMQKNADAIKQGTRPTGSPTSDFVAAARQANLERQQAAGMQMQTTPTAVAATQGGAMTQIQPASPLGGAPLPTMQSHGVLAMPPGGMISQGQPDPAVLAAMYRGY